jgi:hypothetical protein
MGESVTEKGEDRIVVDLIDCLPRTSACGEMQIAIASTRDVRYRRRWKPMMDKFVMTLL